MKSVVAVIFAALTVAACSSNEKVGVPAEPLDRLNNIVG